MRGLALLAFVACTSKPAVPRARFAIAPPVEAVDDKRPIREPQERKTVLALYHFDGSFYRPLMRTLEVAPKQRALGVNALDEVPDSTWFTNRIGRREMSLQELRTGPTTIGNPEVYLPWTIHSMKSEGESLGFTITDARNERFLIKFDRAGHPELETAAHMITGRILWACGYNVPEDFISYITTKDLVLSPAATRKDDIDRKHPLRPDELATALTQIEGEPDGRIRVLASRALPGKPLGGHASQGRRRDDPNDRIPHERRRDLRGTRPIFAWLDHADVKDDNTLDIWTKDGYVVHYFLDFGKSLGGLAALSNDPRRGFEYTFDFPPVWGSLISLGAAPRAFTRRGQPRMRGIGYFDATTYDPPRWHADTPAYGPFVAADRVDWFWGAKILMRFTREQLAAIVDVGKLSDPRARRYLVDTLVARQRATAAYAFSRVAPLDRFEVKTGPTLCFEDLLVSYRLDTSAVTYAIRSFNRNARPLGMRRVQLSQCTQPLNVSRANDGYTIVQIEARGHSVFVHIARDPLVNAWHVVGIYRP